jgi:alpha-glucosidase (family GH31 glycosyl hydrolase)
MAITVGTLGRLQTVAQRGREIVFSFESSDLVLTPLLPNLVRHTWVPTHFRLHVGQVTDSYAVYRRYWPGGVAVTLTETPEAVQVRMGEVLVEATRDPFHLRYCAADGRLFLEEVEEGGLSWSYWEYVLRYQLASEDHFYGMGQVDQLAERVDLDHRGHRREVWNQHSPPAATVFPALLSLRGYGLLIDNPYKATWDLGYTNPATFSYHAQGGGLQYYVWYGPDLPRVLRTFMELTGAAPLPPRWVLGLLQSRYGYRNRAELEEIARTFRAKALPCDALILDVFWFQEMGDLAFQAFDWPDPQGMIAQLKDQGFRLMVIEEPYITVKSRNYPEALAKGYLVTHYDGSVYTVDFWPGKCALLDFSNPETRAWWARKHQPLLELGVAGWWTDLNEPTKHLQDMIHHAGPAAAVHNLIALSMQQAIFEAQCQYAAHQRLFILSRSAFVGSQRYGVGLWSGDVDMTFTALRKQVAVGLNVGLAGIPLWGTDIGGFGFAGTCTPELYLRWFQFGAFCPLFRPHGDQSERREPWQFGAEVEAICRHYLALRYRLLPYIYTAIAEACTTGVPLMRPLILEFPEDPHVLNLTDEYLFGREILVAPVVDEGATERVVYLPAGGWIDFWTDALYRGPCTLPVTAPLHILPLFIREGAVLPLGPEVQYSGQRSLDPLTLEIYRGGEPAAGVERTFPVYEDDGETLAYQTGAYVWTFFQVRENADVLTVETKDVQGEYPPHLRERTYLLNIHRQPSVREVTCSGRTLRPHNTRQALEGAADGWWWDGDKGRLTIKLRAAATELRVEVK